MEGKQIEKDKKESFNIGNRDINNYENNNAFNFAGISKNTMELWAELASTHEPNTGNAMLDRMMKKNAPDIIKFGEK